jgi:hypothetical protein
MDIQDAYLHAQSLMALVVLVLIQMANLILQLNLVAG